MLLPRASGVLLHLTSLPGPHGSGDMGIAAYSFADWLVSAKQTYWQILPLTGLGLGNSPYSSTSAFAGNPLLIDLGELVERGWLDPTDLPTETPFPIDRVDFARVKPFRMKLLERASQHFKGLASEEEEEDFAEFCQRHAAWLDDYALFMALSEYFASDCWTEWPRGLAQHEKSALELARKIHAERVDFWRFCQWSFFRQWYNLKGYVNRRGIEIIGDMPIFVAHHSADVWAHPHLFELGPDGHCKVVSGVPPDAFSATGQRWGNPLYRWKAHEEEGFAWWIDRFRHTFEMVDVLRIDHFRGFAEYWEIPAEAQDGSHGRWLDVPGDAVFRALTASLGESLKAIAEDPGTIIPKVDGLRRRFDLPGMRILQFAFNDDDNVFLPHKHERDAVVYTGTHDNDTMVGWWQSIDEKKRQYARDYLALQGDEEIHWQFIRVASASVANTAIHPLQDILGLDGSARMNRPSQPTGNWEWRFAWPQIQPQHADRLAGMTVLYERVLQRVAE